EPKRRGGHAAAAGRRRDHVAGLGDVPVERVDAKADAPDRIAAARDDRQPHGLALREPARQPVDPGPRVRIGVRVGHAGEAGHVGVAAERCDHAQIRLPPRPQADLAVSASYEPTGDQPRAIAELAQSISRGDQYQTLLGATGTGKTHAMARVIERLNRPALVIAHNKTLAAQLCNEFREFFPRNAVAYFVSYYDSYQPEAYVPQADLHMEKGSSQNDDIARLRLAATSSLFTRRDVVVVASVSCIYGLGSPEEWRERVLILEVGEEHDRDLALRKLIDSQYVRNDSVLGRGRFRVKGDVVEVQPANQETAYRISFFGDEVEAVTHFDPITGEIFTKLDNIAIWP